MPALVNTGILGVGTDIHGEQDIYLLGSCVGSALEYIEAAVERGATVAHLADEYRLPKGS